jgi:hypothetical protein
VVVVVMAVGAMASPLLLSSVGQAASVFNNLSFVKVRARQRERETVSE